VISVEKVVLFGNRSVACNTYYELTYNSSYEVVAFAVDREYIDQDMLFGLPVVPFDGIASVCPPDEHKMLIAVGYVMLNKLRAERYYQAKEMGYELISHVSPKATTWPGLVMGDNCQISPNSVIWPSARIGNDVFIGACCVIAHDAVIGDHCFLSDCVAVSGSVVVEPYCFLGTNSTIRNKVTIARECLVGAGAIILENTEERGVYLGGPADLLPISSDKLPSV
jgi:sugar O-acyltransferase (sialic acid O-acetyltransferase NeuD family)